MYPRNNRTIAELMKVLIRLAAVAVVTLIQGVGPALGEQLPKADGEIKAAWASVFDGHINDRLTRAAKLLSQIDPVQAAHGLPGLRATRLQHRRNDKPC